MLSDASGQNAGFSRWSDDVRTLRYDDGAWSLHWGGFIFTFPLIVPFFVSLMMNLYLLLSLLAHWLPLDHWHNEPRILANVLHTL